MNTFDLIWYTVSILQYHDEWFLSNLAIKIKNNTCFGTLILYKHIQTKGKNLSNTMRYIFDDLWFHYNVYVNRH